LKLGAAVLLVVFHAVVGLPLKFAVGGVPALASQEPGFFGLEDYRQL